MTHQTTHLKMTIYKTYGTRDCKPTIIIGWSDKPYNMATANYLRNGVYLYRLLNALSITTNDSAGENEYRSRITNHSIPRLSNRPMIYPLQATQEET